MRYLLAAFLTIAALPAQETIRLKNRAPFRPTAMSRPLSRVGRPGHYILQFPSLPGPALREDLARRGIRVLNYVPDSALMVSISAASDLRGLDVSWAGTLTASDKISPS